MSRLRNLEIKPAHQVFLFRNGEEVGSFSIPHMDQRFATGTDVIELAYKKSQSIKNQPYNYQVAEDWDTLKLSWWWETFACNQFGELL